MVQRSQSQQNLQGDQEVGICLLEGQVPPETFPVSGAHSQSPHPHRSHLLPSSFWRRRSATQGLEGRDRGTELHRLLLPPHGCPPCGAAPGSAMPSAKGRRWRTPRAASQNGRTRALGLRWHWKGAPSPRPGLCACPSCGLPVSGRRDRPGRRRWVPSPGPPPFLSFSQTSGSLLWTPGSSDKGRCLVLGTRFSHLGLRGDTAALSRGLHTLLCGTDVILRLSQEVVML